MIPKKFTSRFPERLVLRRCGFFPVLDDKIVFQRGDWDRLSFLRLYGLPIPDTLLVSGSCFLTDRCLECLAALGAHERGRLRKVTVMSVTIRSELQPDVAAIDALIFSAFLHAPHSNYREQCIVKALRKAKHLSVSLVAEEKGDIIGHVAVSSVSISDGTQQWYGLGPISFVREWQRQGVGSALMEQALTELRNLSAAGCVVMGELQYYSGFDFKADPELVLPNVPPEYFQAISFGARAPAGRVAYHKAFHI